MDPVATRAARKLGYEDYCKLPEDGLRHEILEGVHVVTGAPLDAHQRVSLKLTLRLGNFLERTKLGKLRVAPYDVRFDAHNVLQPDLLVVLEDRIGRLARDGCHGAPDLVIEILSDSTRARDLVKKRRVFERTGVREFWAVEPDWERIEVYRPEGRGKRYGRPLVLTAEREDVLESELLAGLKLELREVFGE